MKIYATASQKRRIDKEPMILLISISLVSRNSGEPPTDLAKCFLLVLDWIKRKKNKMSKKERIDLFIKSCHAVCCTCNRFDVASERTTSILVTLWSISIQRSWFVYKNCINTIGVRIAPDDEIKIKRMCLDYGKQLFFISFLGIHFCHDI